MGGKHIQKNNLTHSVKGVNTSKGQATMIRESLSEREIPPDLDSFTISKIIEPTILQTTSTILRSKAIIVDTTKETRETKSTLTTLISPAKMIYNLLPSGSH